MGILFIDKNGVLCYTVEVPTTAGTVELTLTGVNPYCAEFEFDNTINPVRWL